MVTGQTHTPPPVSHFLPHLIKLHPPHPLTWAPNHTPYPTIFILLYLHPTPPYLFVHLSPLFYLSNINLSSIYPSSHLSTCPSMHNYLSVSLCIYHLFVSIINLSFICLSICLSIHPLISMHLSILSSSGVKNPPVNAGDAKDAASIPGSGRSPGGGNDNPLQLAWRILWTEEPGDL